MTNDTATLKDFALQLFAYRTVKDADEFDLRDYSQITFVRFFNSAGDYIQLPVCRNFADYSAPIFDETGGNEADPEFGDTQYYFDLKLASFVPRFNKMMDVSANAFAYATTPFVVTDYKLYNGAEEVLAEAADSTINFTITKGTRYMLRFTIRVFNDMVEQRIGEGPRTVIMEDGLRTILRRALHNNSPQDIGSAPVHVGVGGTGAYYITNSDGRYLYNKSSDTYSNMTTLLFPTGTEAGDAFLFCRFDASSPDNIEGIDFDFSAVGVLATDASIEWQYYNEDEDWVPLHSVTDETLELTVDGKTRWLPPTDVRNCASGEHFSSPAASKAGYYYRAILVGAGWAGDFDIPTATTSTVLPLVLKVAHDEVDLQLPFHRKIADTVAYPHTGSVGKIAAEFGLGAVPEQYTSEGLLLRRAYEPVREVGIFTRSAVVLNEKLALGEVVGGTVVGGEMVIPDTNPRPLFLLSIKDNSTGEIFPAARFLEYTVDGSDYDTVFDFVVAGDYDITYLGERITPAITPQNIIGVTGNTQTILGPAEVHIYNADESPSDQDEDAWLNLTPGLIRAHGMWVAFMSPSGSGSVYSPNFTVPGTGGVKAASESTPPWTFDIENLRVPTGVGGAGGPPPYVYDIVVRFDVGHPCVMLTFDFSDYDDIVDVIAVISARGRSNESFGYDLLIWEEGDPNGQTAEELSTGWKMVESSKAVQSDVNLPVGQNIICPIDLKWREKTDGTKDSPRINEANRLFVLIVPRGGAFETGEMVVTKEGTMYYKGTAYVDDTKDRLAEAQAQVYGVFDLSVLYGGLQVNPAQKTGDKAYNFRRGIDWTYKPGDTYAEWRLKGDDDILYLVTTQDGAVYSPILPAMRLGQNDETYIFATDPASHTMDIYTRYKPVDAVGEIYISLETPAGSGELNTRNGFVTINSISWDPAAKWNEADFAHADDHYEANTGDGAGKINITFWKDTTANGKPDTKFQWWSASKPMRVRIRYLYQKDPELMVSYVRSNGLMFARTCLSPLSFSPPLNPAYGDRFRVYYSVEFKHKRSS